MRRTSSCTNFKSKHPRWLYSTQSDLIHRLKPNSREFLSTLNSVTQRRTALFLQVHVCNGFMSNDAERNCDIEKYLAFICPLRWPVKLKSMPVKTDG